MIAERFFWGKPFEKPRYYDRKTFLAQNVAVNFLSPDINQFFWIPYIDFGIKRRYHFHSDVFLTYVGIKNRLGN